jgi:adenylate kinase
MVEKINQLKLKFRTATRKEQAEIEAEMQKLATENPNEFAKAFLENIENTNIEAQNLLDNDKGNN